MKTVAYTSPFVPAEWIAAHGFRPSRLRPGRAAGPLPAAGACPFAEAFEAEAGGDFAAVVFATTCDQMRRASEGPAARLFLLNVPHSWTRAAHRLYLEELRRLSRFLVEIGGRAPSGEELASAMRRYDAARGRLRAARGRLSGRAFAEAAAELHARGDPDYEPPDGPPPGGGKPLALLGGPVWGPHLSLHELVEACGGEVVLDGTETGERTLPASFGRRRLSEDPLLELADAYFGSIPDAFRRPNTALYEWLADSLEERGAKGVLFLACTWCDLWRAELERVRGFCGRPVVGIDLAAEGARSRAETRIQALLDMIP